MINYFILIKNPRLQSRVTIHEISTLNTFFHNKKTSFTIKIFLSIKILYKILHFNVCNNYKIKKLFNNHYLCIVAYSVKSGKRKYSAPLCCNCFIHRKTLSVIFKISAREAENSFLIKQINNFFFNFDKNIF